MVDAGASGNGRHRGELAKAIPRRPRVSWWLGLLMALGFALVVTPAITAERWLGGIGTLTEGKAAPITIRVAAFSRVDTKEKQFAGGGVLIARGEIATAKDVENAQALAEATPRGPLPYIAFFTLTFIFAAIFTHHMRRSNLGRLVRVQAISLATVATLAIAVKVALLATPLSILVVPVALLALIPTLALDRITGLATGVLLALVVSLLAPFDVNVAILLLVQASVAGLVVAERPKARWRAALTAGVVTTVFTAGTYVLLTYLTTGAMPLLSAASSPFVAAAIGPALAMFVAVPLMPLYQLAVGEITHGKLVALEDLSHPLLRQIAERAPGTWQHSLMMANMAEIAANTIGANGRLVRVGAYFHDLGKSLTPKYFIENLEPGETSPHDKLPPEVSCEAIFAHVTEGIVTARKAGMHERIVDFMHMHHGNGVLEYFWGKAQEQGNPRGLTIENFRYPGHPPQSRETAILAICDAVEAASRTLKKPDAKSIDSLVQRIVYGKLHLGQLDESGLSMADLRRVNDSLRETIRHANHGRIEYPWQKQQRAEEDGNATPVVVERSGSHGQGTDPLLDSLDRRPGRDTAGSFERPEDGSSERHPPGSSSGGRFRRAIPEPIAKRDSADALAETAELAAHRKRPQAQIIDDPSASQELGISETAPITPLSGGRMSVVEPNVAASGPTPLASPAVAREEVSSASAARAFSASELARVEPSHVGPAPLAAGSNPANPSPGDARSTFAGPGPHTAAVAPRPAVPAPVPGTMAGPGAFTATTSPPVQQPPAPVAPPPVQTPPSPLRATMNGPGPFAASTAPPVSPPPDPRSTVAGVQMPPASVGRNEDDRRRTAPVAARLGPIPGATEASADPPPLDGPTHERFPGRASNPSLDGPTQERIPNRAANPPSLDGPTQERFPNRAANPPSNPPPSLDGPTQERIRAANPPSNPPPSLDGPTQERFPRGPAQPPSNPTQRTSGLAVDLDDAVTIPPAGPRPVPVQLAETFIGSAAGPQIAERAADPGPVTIQPRRNIHRTERTDPPDFGEPAPPSTRTGPPRPPPRQTALGSAAGPSSLEVSSLDIESEAVAPHRSNEIYMGPGAPAAHSLVGEQDDALAQPPIPNRRTPSAGPPVRHAGPPPRADLENAVTNPPPVRRAPTNNPIAKLPAMIVEGPQGLAPPARPAPGDDDAHRTSPNMILDPRKLARAVTGHDEAPDEERTGARHSGRPTTPADDLHDDERTGARRIGARTSPAPRIDPGDLDKTQPPPVAATRFPPYTSPSIGRARPPTQPPVGVQQPPAGSAPAKQIAPTGTDPGVPKPKPPARPVHKIVEDNSRTDPSMPRFDPTSDAPFTSARRPEPMTTLPGAAPPKQQQQQPGRPWASGLAARIDRALEGGDEWGAETPVVAPTKAELRALLGSPDPTRKVSMDEIERLHRAALEESDAHDEEIFQQPRNRIPPTAEVDPDQIEAAIEVAPPARRNPNPNVVATAKPKKPE